MNVIPIRDRNDLAVLRTEPRAILFLWVNWSGPARTSRTLLEQTVELLREAFPDNPLPCFFVDVSDQCGEIWDALIEWLTTEGRPADQLMWSGAGPILWLRSGRVILHVLAPLQFTASQLAAVTRSAFESAH
jgi:hypothetical protein